MGKPPTNLRVFLRKEVLASRVKLPTNSTSITREPAHIGFSAPSKSTLDLPADEEDDDSLILGASVRGGYKRQDDDMDSIYGERVLTRDEMRKKQMKELLGKSNLPPPRPRKPLNTELERLRDELRTLLAVEAEGGCGSDRDSLQRQKSELKNEIYRLETEEAMREYRERKAQLMENNPHLPEPIGAWEKRRLMNTAERIRQSRAELNMNPEQLAELERQRSPKKRKHEHNTADDFDGEERFYAGQPIKLPPMEVTGHWRATIHNYIPDAHGANFVRDVDPEQKVLMRRELADYAEQAALVYRRQMRMRATEEWLMSRSGQYGYY